METIQITIKTGNAAFDDYPASEVARILRKLATDFEDLGMPHEQTMRDTNGNIVGGIIIK